MSQVAIPATTTVAAALMMQGCLMVIACAGAYLIHRDAEKYAKFYNQPEINVDPDATSRVWIIVFFACLTLGSLLLSDAFAGLWNSVIAPEMPKGASIVQLGYALRFNFWLDIILISLLIPNTGGSERSAFTGIYFILPSLAFFLNEPPKQIVGYVFGIALGFSVGLLTSEADPRLQEARTTRPLWVVSMLGLFLSLFIGYFTRR